MKKTEQHFVWLSLAIVMPAAAVLVPEPPQAARPRAAAEMPATFRKSRREIIFFIRILLQKNIFS